MYRVSPGPANTWRVSIDAGSTIASFSEKSAAVRFALTLARGEGGWQTTVPGTGAARHISTRNL